MDKKLALLCCLLTFIIVGVSVFATCKAIDYPTILHAAKIVIPATICAYICGLYMGKTLANSKADTNILNLEAQQQFIDDLLLSPDEVLNRNTVNIHTEENTEKNDSPTEEKEN